MAKNWLINGIESTVRLAAFVDVALGSFGSRQQVPYY